MAAPLRRRHSAQADAARLSMRRRWKPVDDMSAIRIGGIHVKHPVPRVARLANLFSIAPLYFRPVIPEIDIWRAALVMLKRFGDNAPKESATRPDNLETEGDSRRCRDLAPDHRCRRAAGEHDADRPGALTASAAGPVNPLHLIACDLVARCGCASQARLSFASPALKRVTRLDAGRPGHVATGLGL
jgi:hypothetical protein